jgi:hypothetical protein
MFLRKISSWQWVLIVIALLVALDWAIRRPDGQTRQLNEALVAMASPQLKAFPYPFRVLRVEGDTAVMSTPRNFDAPAFLMLGKLYPDINVKDHNNPKFIEVERLLGRVQDEAKDIVLAQPGIASVRWELDRDWLRRRGIEVQGK